MTPDEIRQLERDVAAAARDLQASRTCETPQPPILDSAFPETAEALAQFLPKAPLGPAAERKAVGVVTQFKELQAQQGAEYCAALLAKDTNRLSDSEKQYLFTEMAKSLRAWGKGELE